MITPIQELLDEKLHGGKLESQGAFRIDVDKASAKFLRASDSSTELPSFDFYDNSKQRFSSSGDGFWTWQCKSLGEWQGEHTPTKHRLLRCSKGGSSPHLWARFSSWKPSTSGVESDLLVGRG